MENLEKFLKSKAPLAYEDSFKIAIAREYLTGSCTQAQLATKYNLGGCYVVSFFVRRYKRHMHEFEQTAGTAPLETSSREQELNHQLHLANLKVTALKMMIKNAERELGVDIRKKSGIKRPVK
ncbi:transposase [Arcticibacter sp.]|uniref:transposase n=1 Tax=Arcticibacter sp. TaxID=1872630 RepID=UPI00388E4986